MNKILVLTVAVATVAVRGAALAASGPALGCLQASAQSGSLVGCLNESGKGAAESVAAQAPDRPAAPSSLTVSSTESGATASFRLVPTPMGYTDAKDGSLKAGFLKGLDSGFKIGFTGIEYPALSGLDASGGPTSDSIGAYIFNGLATLLYLPAVAVGAAVAVVGAGAGMIAEKVSPGSTRNWFSF